MECTASFFDELKSTNPRCLIAVNQEMQKLFDAQLSLIQAISHQAQQLLDAFFAEQHSPPAFPIPIREIAARCNFLLYETEMANQNHMEVDDQGGGYVTTSKIQMRERQCRMAHNGLLGKEIAGSITIDKNLGENAKRFAIAHELGNYVLRTVSPVGPLYVGAPYPGPFAYTSGQDILADDFAYALLVPYSLVESLKRDYECKNRSNPLSYMQWIKTLADKAQVSEHCAILAYNAIRERQLVEQRLIPCPI